LPVGSETPEREEICNVIEEVEEKGRKKRQRKMVARKLGQRRQERGEKQEAKQRGGGEKSRKLGTVVARI